jgi:hypothetical protein
MSDTQAENDSESSLPVFRPFTREELAVIDERIQEKRLKAEKKAERRARNKAVIHVLKGPPPPSPRPPGTPTPLLRDYSN